MTAPGSGGRRLAAVMFTDMVGYTALFQADERDAIAKRQTYVTVVERAHEEHGGLIVARMGDGTMSRFESAVAAVQAAVDLQRGLAAAGVSVRVGVHAGEVIDDGGTIIGDAVNVASRIESFAVPGSVMVSEAVAELVRSRADIVLQGLGQVHMKNVERPVELYGVAAEGIVVPDASALVGKGERYASLPSNLPEIVHDPVGRDADVEQLVGLVAGHRIVTITGPGGVGKTTVLVALGRRLAAGHPDGVAFVGLADVTDPAALVDALAEALDVKEAESRSLADGVAELIGAKRAVLLLDNFEQLVDAAPQIGALISRCPGLRVVVTSRTPLRLAAEAEFTLAPLRLPDESANGVANLLAAPAVALFVERARTPHGAFELTEENAEVVAAICRRLDGLPLAIELAAPRLRLLSPEALLERLGHALDVLTSGSRDLPARQRTLRATIDWSHSLLAEPERRLFRRMSVFSGGFTLESLDAVCSDEDTPGFEGLASLVEKGLVQVAADASRYALLQTIAEFASEQLDEAGERDEIAARHAARYVVVAEEIRWGLETGKQVTSLGRGIAEEANLSAALDGLLGRARSGDLDAARHGLSVCANLHLYWHIRGKNLTARETSIAFLGAAPAVPECVEMAGALRTGALGAWALGQFETANAEWRESARIATSVGDRVEEALSKMFLSIGLIGSSIPEGIGFAVESVSISRDISYEFCQGFALAVLAMLRRASGDLDAAREGFLEALAIQERIEDHEGAGLSLGGLAELAAFAGDHGDALVRYGRSLASFGRIGDRAEEARILSEMAQVHLADGDLAGARQRYGDSVRAYRDVVSARGVGLCLLGLAAVESLEGRFESAVCIAAAGERYASEEGIVNVYTDGSFGFEELEVARAALPARTRELTMARGAELSIEEALDLSLVVR